MVGHTEGDSKLKMGMVAAAWKNLYLDPDMGGHLKTYSAIAITTQACTGQPTHSQT